MILPAFCGSEPVPMAWISIQENVLSHQIPGKTRAVKEVLDMAANIVYIVSVILTGAIFIGSPGFR